MNLSINSVFASLKNIGPLSFLLLSSEAGFQIELLLYCLIGSTHFQLILVLLFPQLLDDILHRMQNSGCLLWDCQMKNTKPLFRMTSIWPSFIIANSNGSNPEFLQGALPFPSFKVTIDKKLADLP